MSKRVILSADSTCDLGEELRDRYSVHYYPYHIILEGESYSDGVDVTPDMIYEIYNRKKILPKTAAINIAEYAEFFTQFTEQGYEVVHITLGRGISASYNNCRLAAENIPGVHVIDSCNLSSGSGMLVIEAANRIADGMSAEQTVNEVRALAPFVNTSFVIDTLEFLYMGGRCSSLQMLGANLLKLKPCIEVNNDDGTMNLGKKYRGTLDKALEQYVADRLENCDNIRDDRVFITHSGISQQRIDMVKNLIHEHKEFREVFVSRAGCTISSHCGPNTLGIIFMTNNS